MKRTVLFFCIILTSLGSTAQTVSGRIIDGTTNQPLDFVNVALYKAGSDKPETGGLSDTNGKFELTAPVGDYTFKATFIGYTEFTKNISLSKSKPHIRLGNITFEDAAKQYSSCPSKERGGDEEYDSADYHQNYLVHKTTPRIPRTNMAIMMTRAIICEGLSSFFSPTYSSR